MFVSPDPVADLQARRSMMQDASTADFAFIFRMDANHEVALWVHQSMLDAECNQFRIFHEFPMNGGIHTDRALDFPLMTYCALVRCIYTDEAGVNMNLDDFCLTDWPVREPTEPDSAYLQALKAAPMPTASWSNFYKLAELYGIEELTELLAEYRDNQGA